MTTWEREALVGWHRTQSLNLWLVLVTIGYFHTDVYTPVSTTSIVDHVKAITVNLCSRVCKAVLSTILNDYTKAQWLFSLINREVDATVKRTKFKRKFNERVGRGASLQGCVKHDINRLLERSCYVVLWIKECTQESKTVFYQEVVRECRRKCIGHSLIN